MLALYPFRFRDPLSGKWIRARHKMQEPELQRARELLTAIDSELAANRSGIADDARGALQELRAEVVEFAAAPVTKH